MTNTPVALFIFNRPQHTARVFAEVAKAKPAKLLVVADGPRPDRPEDADLCRAARAVVDRVDWDCEVLRNYSASHLGCRARVISGLSWVFDDVDESIILEDDCVPSPSFFPYCVALLERFRDDSRIMTICGTNFLGNWQAERQSYHFSMFAATWGWATWRRSWLLYDAAVKAWPEALRQGLINDLFRSPRHRRYWSRIYQRAYDEGSSFTTWDYQWQFSCWLNHTYQVIPALNLVSNIGFGLGATHTVDAHRTAALPVSDLAFPLTHPMGMVRCLELDERIQEEVFNPEVRLRDRIAGKVRRSLPSLRTTDRAG